MAALGLTIQAPDIAVPVPAPGGPATRQHVIRMIRVLVINADAADEWVPTGLSQVIGVIGCGAIGTATSATLPAFVLNANGTGQAENSTMGSLGMEGSTGVYWVTVYGVL